MLVVFFVCCFGVGGARRFVYVVTNTPEDRNLSPTTRSCSHPRGDSPSGFTRRVATIVDVKVDDQTAAAVPL